MAAAILILYLIVLFGLLIFIGWFYDFKRKKEREITYVQKAFKDLADMFDITYQVSTYDGEIYLTRPHTGDRVKLPVGIGQFEKMKKDNDDRWDALVKHLGIRFTRNTQAPINEVVVVKTK